MASLMENLMDILENETMQYEKLLELAKEKTKVIVANDIVLLNKMTEKEQILVDEILSVDKKRVQTMKDIAEVMNLNLEELTIPKLIKMLGARPTEQKRLAAVNDALKQTVTNVARINEQNQELIKNALELVEFDLNLIKGLKAAPQTAEYNKGAMNAGTIMGMPVGGFDAKQ